jgi:nucleoside-diphosphate-sugar epimerase
MEVLVAGGHGKIGLRLLRLLAEQGHRARGLIRAERQVGDLEAVGAHAVLCDLESDDPTPHIGTADAVVFAAGAGPGSGEARKRTMDYGGAVKLVEALQTLGAPRRYLVVSAMGADDPASGGEGMRPYLQAKADADAAVQASGLDFTIVRPGGLTDDPGTGLVAVAPSLGRRGQVTRDDVALVLLACLELDSTIGHTFELLAGDTPVRDALAALAR